MEHMKNAIEIFINSYKEIHVSNHQYLSSFFKVLNEAPKYSWKRFQIEEKYSPFFETHCDNNSYKIFDRE